MPAEQHLLLVAQEVLYDAGLTVADGPAESAGGGAGATFRAGPVDQAQRVPDAVQPRAGPGDQLPAVTGAPGRSCWAAVHFKLPGGGVASSVQCTLLSFMGSVWGERSTGRNFHLMPLLASLLVSKFALGVVEVFWMAANLSAACSNWVSFKSRMYCCLGDWQLRLALR